MSAEKIVVKKGKQRLVIPDDYIPVHVEGTGTYIPSVAAGGGNPKKYASYQVKAHSPYIWTWQNEDNPVWRFRNDIKYMDLDPSTLEGASVLASALTFLAPYDDYGYLNNLSIISQLINTKKGLVDIEKFISKMDAMERVVALMMERIKEPELMLEVSEMLALSDQPAKKGRKR
jgi:hypothetical protein